MDSVDVDNVTYVIEGDGKNELVGNGSISNESSLCVSAWVRSSHNQLSFDLFRTFATKNSLLSMGNKGRITDALNDMIQSLL